MLSRICFLILFFHFNLLMGQSAMINVSSRKCIDLNGEWSVIIDPTATGDYRQVWMEKQPVQKTDFVEYAFEGGPTLHVPGDYNTQKPELLYMEGIVWYKKTFDHKKNDGERVFIHFGAVNYLADVYLNSHHLGKHEGGFTPFQFELTNQLREGSNTIIVRVDSRRYKDSLPGLGYDWFNYGGITREVHLIKTRDTFIDDYFVQLGKRSASEVDGWIQLNGNTLSQKVNIRIPELKVNYRTTTSADGRAEIKFKAKFQRWSPENPKIYNVMIATETDTISDQIGFRNIEVSGNRILLNGQPVFLKGVNIHEEKPYKGGRAYSEQDADTLLNWAKALGCNFVRLAHYPHNEHMVKLAEKMGLMVWDELPVYQHIEFQAPGMSEKMELMMKEMIRRDRNRCAVILWGLANETYDFTPNRTNSLIELSRKCHQLDSSRLITSVMNNQSYRENVLNVWDTLYKYFDVISVNEYLGWYLPWQGKPHDTKWKLVYDKPLIISEFGAEAKFGNRNGNTDEARYWSEEYQEKIYQDQVEMFRAAPNLAGTCAWLLADYRSPGRMHPVFQNGYNRKGLLSEHGEKKKAWFVLRSYYDSIRPPVTRYKK
jgi:beta-glucuronidase